MSVFNTTEFVVAHLKNEASDPSVNPHPQSDTSSSVQSLIIKSKLISFGVVIIISFLLNLKVTAVVFKGLHKRSNHQIAPSILVAHLSAICMAFLFVCIVTASDFINFVQVQGPVLCPAVSFLRNVLQTAFSINVAAIIYERLQNLGGHQFDVSIFKLLFCIWVLPILQALPNLIMTKERIAGSVTSENIPGCKPVLLFGSNKATILNEGFRFLLFHVFVSIYLLLAVLKIRAKLASYHMATMVQEGREQKAYSIRYITFHFVTFTVFWLPTGFMIFLRRTTMRTNVTHDHRPPLGHWLNVVIALLRILYFCLNPFLILLLFENTYSVTPTFRGRNRRAITSVESGDERNANSGNLITVPMLQNNTDRLSIIDVPSEQPHECPQSCIGVETVEMHSLERQVEHAETGLSFENFPKETVV